MVALHSARQAGLSWLRLGDWTGRTELAETGRLGGVGRIALGRLKIGRLPSSAGLAEAWVELTQDWSN